MRYHFPGTAETVEILTKIKKSKRAGVGGQLLSLPSPYFLFVQSSPPNFLSRGRSLPPDVRHLNFPFLRGIGLCGAFVGVTVVPLLPYVANGAFQFVVACTRT